MYAYIKYIYTCIKLRLAKEMNVIYICIYINVYPSIKINA